MPCKICKEVGHNSRTCKQEVVAVETVDVANSSITHIQSVVTECKTNSSRNAVSDSCK